MTTTITAAAATATKAAAPSIWPLRNWYKVDPFRIDALGIVTLLGALEVNNHVGKLVRSRYFEYLPLLGAYVFANDDFTSKQPGYQLYNLKTQIYTPDIAGWFARWLMTQDFRTASSYVQWNVESSPHSFKKDDFIGLAIGILANGFFLAVSVLMGDWWGFANALSMAFSTVARVLLLDRNRKWLDQAVEKELKKVILKAPQEVHDELIFDKKEVDGLKDTSNKVIVILPDARAVALRIPDCLVRPCFVFNPKPPDSKDETKRGRTFPPRDKDTDQNSVAGRPQLQYYKYARMVAWAAFGAHVVTIGMSCLISQIITVVIIVGPTVAITYGLGCDQTRVGSRLHASITELPHIKESEEKRVDMYAFLDLDDDQDESLHKWSLTPHRTYKKWWIDYQERKAVYNRDEQKNVKPLIAMDEKEATVERRKALVKRVDAINAADPAKQPEPKPDPVPNARHTGHNVA